jgi:hypothetical protein
MLRHEDALHPILANLGHLMVECMPIPLSTEDGKITKAPVRFVLVYEASSNA